MIIDCISDLHGFYPQLEGGDLLIVAGDLTAQDRPTEYNQFAVWMKEQNYKKRIVIAGNHDNWIQCAPCTLKTLQEMGNFEYLCDSGTEFMGYRIYGSPWTKTFDGMNPKCKAFCVDTEEELADKWSLIPENTEILITHSPPKYIMDVINRGPYPQNTGSDSLREKVKKMNHKLHVFGHIHEGYGKEEIERLTDGHKIILVNASHVNERYQPVNAPQRIIL
jgi:Icc-related predicted phosphoesterase